MNRERRRAPRVEVLGPLEGHVVSPVTVREVSLGGLSFSSTAAFSIGAIHEFRLALEDGPAVLLRGRVVRSQLHPDDEDGSGLFITAVQFLDAPASIGDLVDKIKTGVQVPGDQDTEADSAPIGASIDKIK